MELQFLGAAGTVTGSRYLLRRGAHKVLVDCGMFQGVKRLRERNRAPFPVDPKSLHAVVLTHAHVDHSGWLPALVRAGFRGHVYCTPGTQALCEILLRDAAKLQEEDARYANKKGFSKHQPAEPLYTLDDAEDALRLFHPVDWHQRVNIDGMSITFHHAGHIIGASSLHIATDGGTLVFSGDVGRRVDPVLNPPEPLPGCDWLVTESTYGNRLHPRVDALELLADAVTRTAQRGGVVVMPAFAVGRAQMILHLLLTLRKQGRIPDMPIYLDSPMASKATEVLLKFPDEHHLTRDECQDIINEVKYVDTVDQSMALNAKKDPHIIVSASGMATGGRVLHHLRRLLPEPRNQVIFLGFQAVGTRGDTLVKGAPYVKIHGEYVPVHAPVLNIDGLSAHADQAELIDWYRTMPHAPRQVFVTHGEPDASDALRLQIQDLLGWPATVPEPGEKFTLQR
ncbi:MAG: MBL fold metallo-hydrolase [Pseudomonadota bacterium]